MSLDDVGIEFVDLDTAYLEAFRAAGEMWLEMSGQGLDASRHSFEITDADGRLLIELPFTEILRQSTRRKLRKGEAVPRNAIKTTGKSKTLAVEIADLVAAARRTIEQTQLVLDRSRSKP